MTRKGIALLILLAVGLTIAAAAASGALNDPLISKEYLEGTYQPALEGQVDEKVTAHYEGLYNEAAQELEAESAAIRDRLLREQQDASGTQGRYSALFLPDTYRYGDKLVLGEGTGLLLLAGAADAAVTKGELIDLTDGVVTSSLKARHRYLAAEGADVTVTVQSEAARIALTGYYESQSAGQTALPFTDISRASWYYEAISYVYGQTLFSGMSADEFWPGYPVTRAMLATVLHRMAGTPAGGSGAFADIEAGSWYEAGVNWSASAGVVKGMEENAFWPNYNVTREQLAVMLHRYAGEYLKRDVSARGDLSPFADRASISGWAGESMAWAVGAGILNGDDTGRLRPGGSATRAEAATMIERFAGLIA